LSSNTATTGITPGEAIAIRATVVVGIIAAILAWRLEPQLIQATTLSPQMISITNILLLYWGLYAMAMAVGIEEKPFGAQVAKACFRMAYNFFVIGLSYTAFGLLVTLLPFIFEPIIRSFSILGVGTTFGIAFLLEDLFFLSGAYRASRKLPSAERRPKLRQDIKVFLVRGAAILPVFFVH
jgi:hypothetical protein